MAYRRPVSWSVLGTLTVPLFLGCFSIYLFRLSGDGTVLAVGLIVLAVGTLGSVAAVLFASDRDVSTAASSIALVEVLALFTALLPGSGMIYVDTAILFAVTAGAVIMYIGATSLPSIGQTRLRESSVLVVLLLPAGLAFAQALFLGLRFWESYQIGKPTLLFVPLLAMWGYVEEGLFRGIVQRSALPLLGKGGSTVLAALAYTAFMLFWGSLVFAIFSFFLGLLMGFLYLRSRSLMYVGTVHALLDIWMIIAYLILGIGVD